MSENMLPELIQQDANTSNFLQKHAINPKRWFFHLNRLKAVAPGFCWWLYQLKKQSGGALVNGIKNGIASHK